MTVDELDTCLLDRLEADRLLAGDHYPRGGSRLLLLLAMGRPSHRKQAGLS